MNMKITKKTDNNRKTEFMLLNRLTITYNFLNVEITTAYCLFSISSSE